MKTTFLPALLIACVFAVGTALAADTPTAPKPSMSADSVIELPAARGNIPFPHKKHQGMPINCSTCHEPGPWKIKGLGKEWGHTVCRGCHGDTTKAPINCSGCHSLAPPK